LRNTSIDDTAKNTVAELIKDAGYVPVDIETLDESAQLVPSGVLWNSAITELELRERMGQLT
jgi:predicted dinucleotide-binding enzyme